MAKKIVALSQIEEQLQDQLSFLERSCNTFDEGYRDEFKRLAVTIRVLVHDTAKSHSLLAQLGMKGGNFVSYFDPIDGKNLLPDWPLGMVEFSAGADVRLVPVLNQGPSAARPLPFDDWWNEIVYRDPSTSIELDRKTIILIAANQDGGAHVDKEIDERYLHLVDEGPGLVLNTAQGAIPFEDLEKICVRHIAFEVIESIRPAVVSRVGNRGCACGSGRKHRYCCGKK